MRDATLPPERVNGAERSVRNDVDPQQLAAMLRGVSEWMYYTATAKALLAAADALDKEPKA